MNATSPVNTNAQEIPIRHKLRYSIDNQLLLNILLLGTLLLIALLGVFVFVQLSTRPPPLFFKLNANKQIIEPVPLDKEGITKPELLNWINEALTASFSFNYSNENKQPSKLSPYFSENALQIYLNLLQNDEDFNIIIPRQFVVSVRATAAPEIVTGKPYKGRYVWQIRIPAQITFSNALSRGSQEVIMEYLVWRVPETESALGITIASFGRKLTGRSRQQAKIQGF